MKHVGRFAFLCALIGALYSIAAAYDIYIRPGVDALLAQYGGLLLAAALVAVPAAVLTYMWAVSDEQAD